MTETCLADRRLAAQYQCPIYSFPDFLHLVRDSSTTSKLLQLIGLPRSPRQIRFADAVETYRNPLSRRLPEIAVTTKWLPIRYLAGIPSLRHFFHYATP